MQNAFEQIQKTQNVETAGIYLISDGLPDASSISATADIMRMHQFLAVSTQTHIHTINYAKDANK